MATVYSHTYEIKFDGVSIEGEMSFGAGNMAVKQNSGYELTNTQLRQVQALFDAVEVFYRICPQEIKKIEIVKKG